MRHLKTETSRAIVRASKRINRFYGARYHWTIIRSGEHYAHASFYVFHNPVKHKAVGEVEASRWSTLFGTHKKFKDLIVKKDGGFEEYVPQDLHQMKAWLNQNPQVDYIRNLEKALKR